MVLNERAPRRVRAEVARPRRKFHASLEAESLPEEDDGDGDGDATTVTLLCVSACEGSGSVHVAASRPLSQDQQGVDRCCNAVADTGGFSRIETDEILLNS